MTDNTLTPQQKTLYAILASIPKTDLDSLLVLLMCASAIQSGTGDAKALQVVAKSRVTGANRASAALGTDIIVFLVRMIRGESYEQEDFLESIKSLRQGVNYELKHDKDIDFNTLDILKATTTYLATGRELALKKIKTLVPSMKIRELTQSFIGESGSQDAYSSKLRSIVKKMTGAPGTILTRDQVLELKERSPEAHRTYLQLRKGYNDVWKRELQNYVFSSGSNTVLYQKLLKHLDQLGMETPLPRGFTGKVDANGKLYTTADKLINGVPGFGFEVQMNPNYDPATDNEYVFTTIGPEGNISQYVYTTQYRKTKNAEKFEKVKDLDAVIESVHKKWIPQLKKQDYSLECVASTMLEVLYMFSARIGSAGNSAGGQSTFGISTLEVRHLKFAPGKCLIQYMGKDGIRQRHLLEASASPIAKQVYNNLKLFVDQKEPKERVFTFEVNGRWKPMIGGIVNAYFKRLGSPVTVHKLRHLKGTELFTQLMADQADLIFKKRTKPWTEAEATALLKKFATQVGALLGHVRGAGKQEKVTPATAIANYISPQAMMALFDTLDVRYPRFLEKIINKDAGAK